jgi:site-specific DNA-methyltransferase (adenine-specific)
MEIKIDPEFKALIPPLSPEEKTQLEKNILAEGCRDALVVWNGFLLDGHNRFEICEKHGLPYKTETINGDEIKSRVDARIWIRNNQKGRRNLTPAWMIELELGNKEDLLAKGKEKREQNLKQNAPDLSQNDKSEPEPPPHRTRETIAKAAGVSTGQVGMAEQVRKKAPDLWDKAKSGDVTISAAYKKVKRESDAEKKAEEQKRAIEKISREAIKKIESVCDLRNCSCADLFRSGIKPDAVITDPPYPKEFLGCFTELAEGCKLAGVPLVAVMSGQSYLPEVIQRLCEHLKYRWTMAYLTPGGQAVQQWQAKVNTTWKPVLLFGEALDWFGDVASSKTNDNDKRFHGWGQSESGMADLVSRLTKPDQLVCDPFLGGGTTAVVSLALGRRFIGCDIDQGCIEKTRLRVLR